MTDQLLTLAREDAGIANQSREPVNLASLVREVADTMRPFAGSKDQNITVTGDEQAFISADAERLRQALRNLLTNAIKYTPPGGRVEVSLDRRDSEITVAVRDTGIGIASEHLSLVFDRFYRVDPARSDQDGGVGLGLSIVKSIVTAHGGRVEAASTPGTGSVFRVHLPAATGHGTPNG